MAVESCRVLQRGIEGVAGGKPHEGGNAQADADEKRAKHQLMVP